MDFTSRETLAATLELAPVSLIVADREGRIVAWNRASEALFGFAAPEVIGQSLDIIIPEHLRAAVLDVAAAGPERPVERRAAHLLDLHVDPCGDLREVIAVRLR